MPPPPRHSLNQLLPRRTELWSGMMMSERAACKKTAKWAQGRSERSSQRPDAYRCEKKNLVLGENALSRPPDEVITPVRYENDVYNSYIVFYRNYNDS